VGERASVQVGASVQVCMCACVHVCMCACVHVCMCACVWEGERVSVHVVCLSVCVCVRRTHTRRHLIKTKH